MKSYKEKLKLLLTGLLLIPFLGFGIGNSIPAPANVQVLPLEETKEFFAFGPCDEILQKIILEKNINKEIIFPIKKSEAYDSGYKPNGECINTGAFFQDGRSVTGMFLEKIGLLKPKPSRWNSNGSWNW